MDIFYQAASLVQQAGFHVQPTLADQAFEFEDQTVYGFVRLYRSVEEMLGKWEAHQDAFLSSHAGHIRSNPAKAWNAYAIFLTFAAPTEPERAGLLKIEEDFRGTRKIAQAGIETPDQLKYALLPLLPIDVKLGVTDSIQPRLEERLAFLTQEEVRALVGMDARKIIAAAMSAP